MKIEIKGKGEVQGLVQMLAWIELLGNVGHSADFKVFCDGDGKSRWIFKFEDEETQLKYDQIRKEMLKENLNTHKDIEKFSI